MSIKERLQRILSSDRRSVKLHDGITENKDEKEAVRLESLLSEEVHERVLEIINLAPPQRLLAIQQLHRIFRNPITSGSLKVRILMMNAFIAPNLTPEEQESLHEV